MDKVADVLVQTLAAAGVDTVFGLVGTSTIDIADAIVREPGIEFVSARTEEGAAHMADGYARATGRVGVVLAHVGPGALRLLYGIGTSWKDSVPLLALTGNEVARHLDGELREGYHVLDVLDVFRPVCKATIQLREGEDVAGTVARALWLVTSGRPGPVLLDLPKNAIKATPAPAPSALPGLSDTVPALRQPADREQVQEVAAALQRASRPVLLAGGGVHWSDAAPNLARLAEARNLPVVTTDGGRGALPESHPRFLGVVARQAGDPSARSLLDSADLLLAIGTPFSDVSTFEWSAWSEDAVTYRVDITPDVGRKGLVGSLLVPSDAQRFLDALEAELDNVEFRHPGVWEGNRASYERGRAEHLALADVDAGGTGVNPWRVIAELEQMLPGDAFVSVDSGMHSYFGKQLRVCESRSYLRSAGLGAMGYSFPAVLGALEAAPERRGVAIVGDGCLSMCLAEFETAARRQSQAVVVVLNDSTFASQLNHQHRRMDGREVGTRFLPTDFVAVARAQGVHGRSVTDDGSVKDAIAEALAAPGPFVLDVAVNSRIRPPRWIEGSGDERIAHEAP